MVRRIEPRAVRRPDGPVAEGVVGFLHPLVERRAEPVVNLPERRLPGEITGFARIVEKVVEPLAGKFPLPKSVFEEPRAGRRSGRR